ncbi:MAG: hypothetical protein HBSAPP02_15330 [Phycisphaerae bacterium]|nr:MAG: hypothetical protein HBSAPP02_15330 [Phycisphaerae bacterium]
MIRNVARNVWQISGFPPGAINCYLVGDGDRHILIDAGSKLDRRVILRRLRGANVSLVALTHVHPDHQGAVVAVCNAFNCPLACHDADRPAMEGRSPMLPDKRPIRWSSRFFGGPPRQVDQSLRDGDNVAGFRVLEAPGHTPGHVIFFREADRVAIAGDLATNMNFLTLRPGLHQPPAFFSVDPARNRASFKKLVELNPGIVLFGHGPPLRDMSALRAFAQRLERGQRAAAEGV